MTTVRLYALAFALTMPLLLTGCIGTLFGVNLTFVGEKTALEQQVLGNYNAMGQDLAAYGSVRAVQPDGSIEAPPPTTESQRAAITAMANRRYNVDDVEILLRAGAIGEGNDGLLVVLSIDTVVAPLSIELARQIILEENNDRTTIINRLMETTPGVTANDRGDVAWIMASLAQDGAPVGSSIQDRAGNWRRK